MRLRSLAFPGSLLVLLTVAALALHVPGADTVGTDQRKVLFVVLLAAAAACYFAAVHVVLQRQSAPRVIWVVLLVAVAMRLPDTRRCSPATLPKARSCCWPTAEDRCRHLCRAWAAACCMPCSRCSAWATRPVVC